jgi:hypothetical protein
MPSASASFALSAAISTTLLTVSTSGASSLAGETTPSLLGARPSNGPQRGDGKGPQSGPGKQNQQERPHAAQNQQHNGPRA